MIKSNSDNWYRIDWSSEKKIRNEQMLQPTQKAIVSEDNGVLGTFLKVS